MKRIIKFLTSWPFFIFLWFGLIFILVSQFRPELLYLIFALCSLLICSHVLFAGHYILNKAENINLLIAVFAWTLYVLLLLLNFYAGYPIFWFMILAVMFIWAASFHMYYKTRIAQVYLQEYCNYKIFLELGGVLLGAFGIIFIIIFPRHPHIIGLVTLIVITKLNLNIIKRKALYKINYAPAAIPDNPLLSIIIIAYNEEKYIGNLLECIRKQDYKNYEVIVVDDHSTDKTVQIVESFQDALPVRWVQKPLRGASRSRNYGAGLAKGEVILFLDSDVLLESNFISANLKVFRSKGLSVAGVDFIPYENDFLDLVITYFYRSWLKTVQYSNPRGIGFCLFATKELHKKVTFDETIVMSEDFDYIKRAAALGKFRIIDAVPVRVSWRRFHRENRFILILKYLFFEWYRQNIGEIRRKLLAYEFGNK